MVGFVGKWCCFGKEINLGRLGKYAHKPVSTLMGSEAPSCGGGLSGNCLLIIHFIF